MADAPWGCPPGFSLLNFPPETCSSSSLLSSLMRLLLSLRADHAAPCPSMSSLPAQLFKTLIKRESNSKIPRAGKAKRTATRPTGSIRSHPSGLAFFLRRRRPVRLDRFFNPHFPCFRFESLILRPTHNVCQRLCALTKSFAGLKSSQGPPLAPIGATRSNV
jgi:hypothetical protein